MGGEITFADRLDNCLNALKTKGPIEFEGTLRGTEGGFGGAVPMEISQAIDRWKRADSTTKASAAKKEIEDVLRTFRERAQLEKSSNSVPVQSSPVSEPPIAFAPPAVNDQGKV